MGISEEELLQSLEPQKSGISEEEAVGSVSFPEQAKQSAAAFATGVGQGVPFGQDIIAALGTALSYTGAGPRYVPTEGKFGERFTAAKKAQKEAAERMGEESPMASAAGQLTGIVGSIPMFEAAAPVEAMFASKAVPAAERILGTGPYAEEAINAASQGLKGAWQSGVTGLGEGDTLEERLQNAKTFGMVGGGLGFGLPLLTKGVRKATGLTPLSETEQAALEMGAPMPASVSSTHPITKFAKQAYSVHPFLKATIEKGEQEGQEKLGAALLEKTGLIHGLKEEGVGSTVKNALNNWIKKDSADYLTTNFYDKVDRMINPRTTAPMSNLARALNTVQGKRTAAKLGVDPSLEKMLRDAATDARGLTYDASQYLKRTVGQQLDQKIVNRELSSADKDLIYGAIKDDVRNIVKKSGGNRALRAFDQATVEGQKVIQDRQLLADIVGVKGNRDPEDVFITLKNAVRGGSRGDEALLAKVREKLPPSAWNDLSSVLTENLGMTRDGFRAKEFTNAFYGMSDGAKDILYGPVGSPMRKAVEDVYKISDQYVKAGKDNHYSKLALAILGGVGLGLPFMQGFNTETLGKEVAGVAATLPFSAILAKPRLAHMFARVMANPTGPMIKTFQDMARETFKLGATQHVARKAIMENKERPQRASGGKIETRDYPAKKLSRVEKALKRAQDALALETKPIMNIPDEAVANALRTAK